MFSNIKSTIIGVHISLFALIFVLDFNKKVIKGVKCKNYGNFIDYFFDTVTGTMDLIACAGICAIVFPYAFLASLPISVLRYAKNNIDKKMLKE